MCVTCGCSSNDSILHNHNKHHYEHDNIHHHHAQGEIINLESEILAQNNQFAAANREFFNAKKILALNLISSPGSGKTTLLEKTILQIAKDYPLYVIEGDQHTELDAMRIRKAGAIAHQINTGKACHLDGHMVSHALEHLQIKENSFTFIENVGNLICPALFDLGECAKIVLISVTEGEDKPLKYPNIFINANLVIITKMDLLPFLDFDLNQCKINIRKINSKCKIIELAAITGSGFDNWISWLNQARSDYAKAK